MMGNGRVFALSSAVAFSMSYLLLRQGMHKATDDGAFITTFINAVLFSVLVALLALGGRLPAMTKRGSLLFIIAGVFTTYGAARSTARRFASLALPVRPASAAVRQQ